jgi:two-component system response regulator FimZ (fimbrial Z protein)/two-component system response regulator EvgA
MRNKVMLVDDHPAMLMAMKAMLLNQILFEVVGKPKMGRSASMR